MALTITIDGTNRTALLDRQSLLLTTALTSKADTARFRLKDSSGAYLPGDDDVVTVSDGVTTFFGGLMVKATDASYGRTGILYECECVDYGRNLDRLLINVEYTNQTAGAIVTALVALVNAILGGSQQFTTVNVQTGPAIDKISFRYLPFSRCLDKLYNVTGYEWYVDNDRDVHFFSEEVNPGPWALTYANRDEGWRELKIARDASQRRNKVYIRGATYEGDETTVQLATDGVTQKWYIGVGVRNPSVAVNFVGKSLGNDNVDDADDFYWNGDGLFLRQHTLDPVLASSDVLQLTYKPLIPVRAVVPNDSDISSNGVWEHLVQDPNITTLKVARLRGKLEWRGRQINGTFKTFHTGWRAGQYFSIDLSGDPRVARNGLTGTGLVTRTDMRFAGYGTGGAETYETTVTWEVIQNA